ncbi:hypothetical protein H2200_004717 [Cladophialophora chaetospira]|uniref:1-alkyl-2-acetylglycerophosphocholine esterase n=1 Tax=Cladophialophora chaetospira TaxID=386627 RepID=A0AA38XDM2_9EURO|nr:hypothetical protein H2200_004717 [Cladophialophora chaetospira]
MFFQFLLSALPALAWATYTVHHPNGTYKVSVQDRQLNNTHLPDPYLPLPYRLIEISIITPVANTSCKPVTQPYIAAPKSAHFWEQALTNLTGFSFNGTISQTVLELCKPEEPNTAIWGREKPVILFAPGAGYPRQLYSILLTTLVAKSGYTIISFEQPGYAEFETFPDGTTETGKTNVSAGNGLNFLVQDVSFILDTLHNSTNSKSTKVGMFGHSEGGAVTAASILADPRLLGGINLDGAFYGPPLAMNASINVPFAIFSSSIHNQSTSPSWPVVWANLYGDKWQIQLNDSQHASYGDFPFLADLWGLRNGKTPKEVTEVIDELVGGIGGGEAVEAVSELVKTFFDVLFEKEDARDVVNTADEEGVWKVQNVTVVS